MEGSQQMFRVPFGRSQFYLFLLRYHSAFWMSAIATVVGVGAFFLGWLVPSFRSVATPATILGALSTLLGLVLFIREVRAFNREQNGLYARRRPITSADGSLTLHLSDTYSSYKTLSFRDQTVIYSPRVNALLRERTIPYHYDRRRFRVNDAARLIAPLALRRAYSTAAHIFNSPKVRLRYDPTEQAILSGTIAELQRTDYFSELYTNAMVEWQVLSKADNSLRFDGVDLMANNGTILDLADTDNGCTNLMGLPRSW